MASSRITEAPVLVTGANGYIASWIVKSLLERGYKVRGTVRGVEKGAHLKTFTNAENLELVEADLLTEGAYDAACVGIEYVLHTASPYTMAAKNPQTDLVDPALKGTLNVLRACEKAGSVKKVVLTSSIAAIQQDSPADGTVFDESKWNTSSSLTNNPYCFSKVEAEKAAWKFVEELPTEKKFELVTIHPGTVIGPSFTKTLNPSVSILYQFLTGAAPAVFKMSYPIVDVRDTAEHHILAMENKAAKGRYLSVNESLELLDISKTFKENGFQKYPLPANIVLPKPIAWLYSYTQKGQAGQYIRSYSGRAYSFSHDKIVKELGATFKPAKESILDTGNNLVELGFLKDKRVSATQ